MHAFSLVIGSILSHNIAVAAVKKAQRIVTYFRASHMALSTLQEDAKKRGITTGLVSSNTTRFTSVCMCIDSVLRLRRVLEGIAEMQPPVIQKQEVVDTILDKSGDFWGQLQLLGVLLRPFSLVVTAIQSKTALLADVYRYFLYLAAEIKELIKNKKLTGEYAKHVCAAYNMRYKDIVEPICVLALVLHPRFRAAASYQHHGIKYLCNAAGRLLQQLGKGSSKAISELSASLIAYIECTGAFAADEAPVNDSTDPQTWWKQIPDEHVWLKFVALKVLEIVPHAADVERLFSMMGWFNSDRRARMSNEVLEQLSKVKMHIDNIRCALASNTQCWLPAWHFSPFFYFSLVDFVPCYDVQAPQSPEREARHGGAGLTHP